MGFSPGQVRYGFSVTKEIDSKMFFGVKGLYPTLFPGGRSVTKILFTQSKSAGSKPVSASGPLCPHSRPTQPSSGPLSLALPPLQPLLCSPAALQPCYHVMPRALGRALFIESRATYCPQVCSELVIQGQVRILATGTLILSTPRSLRILFKGMALATQSRVGEGH